MEDEILFLCCVKFRVRDLPYTFFTENEFVEWCGKFTRDVPKLYEYWPEIISIYIDYVRADPKQTIGGLIWSMSFYRCTEIGVMQHILSEDLMNKWIKKVFAQKKKARTQEIYNLLVLCDDEALRLYARNSYEIENNICQICQSIFHKSEYTYLIEKMVNIMGLPLKLVLRKIFSANSNTAVCKIIFRAKEIEEYVRKKWNVSIDWEDMCRD